MLFNHTVSFVYGPLRANPFKTSHKVGIYWPATCYSVYTDVPNHDCIPYQH